MIKPVRLRLSRRKGFNLQAWSREVNGLAAVKVDRSTRFGNHWRVGMYSPRLGREIETVQEAVDAFRLSGRGPRNQWWICDGLRGNNLACWCALDDAPCHADFLLKLANGNV